MFFTASFSRLIIFAALLLLFHGTSSAISQNGFDLGDTSIPVEQILRGGPPRDGIPAIDKPVFLTAEGAGYMNDDDRLLGVVIDGHARAYPIKILDWHEIVNDSYGNTEFVVTYCPLCGTGMVFTAEHRGEPLDFGVSGLLYQSDVLFYDRTTESLWSQIMGEAVSGKLKGEKLKKLPVFHTNWKAWLKQQPDTLVLSTSTGFIRDYTRSPYEGYGESKRLYFAVNHKAPSTYHPKENVLGIELNGKYKAYPHSELAKNDQSEFSDNIGGTQVTIHWDRDSSSAHVTNTDGSALVSLTSFWFAWFTFHPDTEVFKTLP